MSDGQKQYVTASGFVQFDPVEREANGKTVFDIVIRTEGGDGKNIRVTIWPEFQLEAPIERGDWVGVDGTFSSSTYQGQDGSPKTSLQISPYKLVTLKSVKRTEREVVAGSSTATKAEKIPF